MGFNCGIVGLPNVGKSTLFNALTNAGAEAQNYPFCTIEPNVGIVPVNDPRLDHITQLVKPEKTIPTTVEFVDIAGLVKGASKGEGLGNQFLGNIKNVDAIVQVVRCFEDSDVVHVHGDLDPLRDIEVIQTELILADLQSVSTRKTKISKLARSGDKDAQHTHDVLVKIEDALNNGQSIRELDLEESEQEILADLFCITQKPILYVCNVSESAMDGNNDMVQKVQSYAQDHNAKCLVVCASIESEIAEMNKEEKQEFLKDYGLTESGLDRLARAGYDLLNLITYFTAGPKEVRAWTIANGTLAPGAAGKIHTDFEKGFIRAEVYHYNDLTQHQSEAKVKEAGLLRVEGKDYLVHDGDIMHFRFNV